MNARMVGDVLHAGGFKYLPRQARERRGGNGTPIWRNSYEEGQLEDRLWRPIARGKMRAAKRLLGARLKAARMLEKKTRIARRQVERSIKNGALGPVAIEVLEYFYNIVDFMTGRLEPAVQSIADNIGRSYGAVHNALKALRRQGFLQWIRRSRSADNKGQAGPQSVQIPSAYVLLFPQRLQPLVDHIMGKGPLPVDMEWHREQQKRDYEDILSRLSSPEFLKAVWDGDDALGESLKRIAELLDQERESTKMRDSGGLYITRDKD